MTDVLRIIIAPLAWLATFSAVYGLHGFLCGHGIDGTILGVMPLERAVMAGAFGVSVMLLAAVLWGLHAPRFASDSPFVRFVSRTTGWVGFVATVWTLFPALATTSCL